MSFQQLKQKPQDLTACYDRIVIYDEYSMQKFVRRKASILSKKNIEPTERLIKEAKMQCAGLKAIEAAKKIAAAKKEETKQKRIKTIIEMLEREEKFH